MTFEDVAGIDEADLLIACTSRDEANIIAAIFAKKLSSETKTIVRTTETEFLEVWHERQLDVDFVVSSELEAAYAVSQTIGVPAARQTDVFADGQVQIVEFDVEPGGAVHLPRHRRRSASPGSRGRSRRARCATTRSCRPPRRTSRASS